MKLVVDASTAIPAAIAGTWSPNLADAELHAPSLLWSEVAATLRQLEWRGEVAPGIVDGALEWLERQDITATPSSRLISEARLLAAQFGWAKTYDAEYVALAARLRSPLVTIDARLRRTVSTVVGLVDPAG